MIAGFHQNFVETLNVNFC